MVFDSTRFNSGSGAGALAIGRSLGGYNYDWDYRGGGGGGDIWGARGLGLGLGGIWGFGGGAGEKDGEVGRRPEMREVVLGVVGGTDGGQEDVPGFGFGGWKVSLIMMMVFKIANGRGRL